MKQYLAALKDVLENGDSRPDRTGVGTISKFGVQLRFDLAKGFPAVTTKKLAWKSVVSELLWFIEGSNDERRLAEILYGDRMVEKKTIWTDNANSDYWVNRRLKRSPSDLGRIYGVQWRKWRKPLVRINKVILQNHDQLIELINGIKEDPYSRRHILSAWNPGELDLMALPPCHVMVQFNVREQKYLSCALYQRSGDVGLGVPFNIASYAFLTHILAKHCDLIPEDFVYFLGNAHIYESHIPVLEQQLLREPYAFPKICVKNSHSAIEDYCLDDIHWTTPYFFHETLKMDMVA